MLMPMMASATSWSVYGSMNFYFTTEGRMARSTDRTPTMGTEAK